MRNKIIKYAIISSPLLALYGASPFYIFDILPIEKSFIIFLSALMSMIMYWSFNTYLFLYSNITSKWILYPLSFFFAYFSNIFKIIFGIDPTQLRGDVVQYMLFPLITVLALNSIILIILNSIIQEEERRKADQRITTLQLKNLKAQKQTLTQQLQPHFLFNALSILKSLIYQNSLNQLFH